MFFKCQHPARFLAVEKKETTKQIDGDFMCTTYHFICRKCHEKVEIKHASLIALNVTKWMENGWKMETDHELLELAARAVDLPECGWMGPTFIYVKDNTFTEWNPLRDDATAFRLAVKLNIEIQFLLAGNPRVCAIKSGTSRSAGFTFAWNDNKAAATRRAIVCCAADIGKKK